jgi:flagellar L-ring protein FlgH
MFERWIGMALVVGATAASSSAQSSSMWRATADAPPLTPAPSVPGAPRDVYASLPSGPKISAVTRALEEASPIAIPSLPQRRFRVNDLVTIIVRQQKNYRVDGRLDSKKEWDVSGKLSEWFRFYEDHRLGSATLRHGQPGFDFEFANELRSRSQANRSDSFTTRLQSRIIDVKPNGNLVLEARVQGSHDEERWTITLTGMCRSEDVTPDNSILSTQIAELVIEEKNHGAVRDSTRRGWIPSVLDWLRPF